MGSPLPKASNSEAEKYFNPKVLLRVYCLMRENKVDMNWPFFIYKKKFCMTTSV